MYNSVTSNVVILLELTVTIHLFVTVGFAHGLERVRAGACGSIISLYVTDVN